VTSPSTVVEVDAVPSEKPRDAAEAIPPKDEEDESESELEALTDENEACPVRPVLPCADSVPIEACCDVIDSPKDVSPTEKSPSDSSLSNDSDVVAVVEIAGEACAVTVDSRAFSPRTNVPSDCEPT
jgi:hypothetical protein